MKDMKVGYVTSKRWERGGFTETKLLRHAAEDDFDKEVQQILIDSLEKERNAPRILPLGRGGGNVKRLKLEHDGTINDIDGLVWIGV